MKKTVLFGLALFLSASFFAQQAKLSITLSGIKHSEGKIRVTLYTSESDFMKKFFRELVVTPVKGKLQVEFKNLPLGVYGAVALHDENNDGKSNRNFIGIPKEGYGLSTNPSLMRKPVFSDVKFNISGDTSLEIKMKY